MPLELGDYQKMFVENHSPIFIPKKHKYASTAKQKKDSKKRKNKQK